MRENIPEQELKELKAEFDSLKSIDEKYEFWEQRLGMHYALWSETIYKDSYKYFHYISYNPDEYEAINNRNLEYLKSYRNSKSWSGVLILENLIREFNTELENGAVKEGLIEDWKEMIDEHTKPNQHQYTFSKKARFFQPKPELVKAFKTYRTYKEKPNFKEEIISDYSLINRNNGYVLGQLLEFLNSEGKLKIKKKNKSLTHAQQVLVLDYLGIMKDNNNITQKGRFYGAIIGEDAENTRQKINYIESSRNIKNLEKLKEIFAAAKLKEPLQKVENDINRILKK